MPPTTAADSSHLSAGGREERAYEAFKLISGLTGIRIALAHSSVCIFRYTSRICTVVALLWKKDVHLTVTCCGRQTWHQLKHMTCFCNRMLQRDATRKRGTHEPILSFFKTGRFIVKPNQHVFFFFFYFQ